ncbi:DUF484 family protein [Lonepinella sp. MS14436]|uniref:DUF484 family protein n=1 Tax=Lonepinella sp. MS14436 TaxID=3003619 RepID=UPI0036DCC396
MSENILEQQVVKFLQNTPYFFAQHLDLLDTLVIPHAQKGSLSLVEMQLERQREQIKILQSELAIFQQLAHQEQDIFFALMPLQKKLASAETLEQGIEILNQWAKKFDLQQVKLLLFRDKWQGEQISDKNWLDRKGFELIRLERFGLRRFYLGELSNREKSLLFLLDELPVGSVACCLLGIKPNQHQANGILLFSARDTQHFYNGQDTAFLSHLVDIVELHLHRWLLPCEKQ